MLLDDLTVSDDYIKNSEIEFCRTVSRYVIDMIYLANKKNLALSVHDDYCDASQTRRHDFCFGRNELLLPLEIIAKKIAEVFCCHYFRASRKRDDQPAFAFVGFNYDASIACGCMAFIYKFISFHGYRRVVRFSKRFSYMVDDEIEKIKLAGQKKQNKQRKIFNRGRKLKDFLIQLCPFEDREAEEKYYEEL